MAQTQETEESKLFCCKSYQQRKKGSARLLVLGVFPPPSRGSSPLLPVCKSYQQRKKRPSRGVYPPPRGAGSRYYPYAKVINSARDPLPGPLQRF